MPDPERLKELLRQREQLEREIASASGKAPAAAPAPVRKPLPAKSQPTAASDADAIIARYSDAGTESAPISKQGCWMVFTAVMLVLIGVVAVIYFVRYR